MINDKYLEPNDELKLEFRKVFLATNEKNVFIFLRKYLKSIENSAGVHNRLIITKKADLSLNKKFLSEFNKTIWEYLHLIVNTGVSKHDNKERRGEAANYMGIACEFGLFGQKKNLLKAFKNYKIASQLNNPLGTFRLAQCYELGLGTKKCNDRALNFYRCAAKLGLVDAMHTYGMIQMQGLLNAPNDFKTGFYYLSMAESRADKLYPFACYDLGKYYEKDHNGELETDEEYSVAVYMRGSNRNDPNAQFRLGKAYEKGELGLIRNMGKAMEFYIKSANNGHVEAQVILCGFYFSGIPEKVPRNSDLSYYWALRAATQGNNKAALFMGEFAQNGIGTTKSDLLGLWWYKIAEYYGSNEGKQKAKDLNRHISDIDAGSEIQTVCCSFFCFNKV